MSKDTRTTIKLNRNMQAIVDKIILLHPLRTHGSPTEAVELALDEWYGGGNRLTMEVSESSGNKLHELAEMYGTQTTVLEISLDRMYREEIKMDRTSEINWLRECAENMLGDHSGVLDEQEAEDLICFWENSESGDPIEWPDWFDRRMDRRKLIEFLMEFSR